MKPYPVQQAEAKEEEDDPAKPFLGWATYWSNRVASIINNTSIISTAASVSGLSSYRFGRTVTCPFPENASEFPYEIIQKNKSIDAHTLVLLDIDLPLSRFLAVDEAINVLQALEKEKSKGIFTTSSVIIGLARIGYDDEYISGGVPSKVKNAYNWNDIGPPQALIVCSDVLHFSEEEALSVLWGVSLRE